MAPAAKKPRKSLSAKHNPFHGLKTEKAILDKFHEYMAQFVAYQNSMANQMKDLSDFLMEALTALHTSGDQMRHIMAAIQQAGAQLAVSPMSNPLLAGQKIDEVYKEINDSEHLFTDLVGTPDILKWLEKVTNMYEEGDKTVRQKIAAKFVRPFHDVLWTPEKLSGLRHQMKEVSMNVESEFWDWFMAKLKDIEKARVKRETEIRIKQEAAKLVSSDSESRDERETSDDEDVRRCRGTTADGSRCKRVQASDYCQDHKTPSRTTSRAGSPAEVPQRLDFMPIIKE